MLVLSRRAGERIRIGDDVVLTVVRVQGDKVRLGIEAPPDVAVHREEVFVRVRAAADAAAGADRPAASVGARAALGPADLAGPRRRPLE